MQKSPEIKFIYDSNETTTTMVLKNGFGLTKDELYLEFLNFVKAIGYYVEAGVELEEVNSDEPCCYLAEEERTLQKKAEQEMYKEIVSSNGMSPDERTDDQGRVW